MKTDLLLDAVAQTESPTNDRRQHRETRAAFLACAAIEALRTHGSETTDRPA